MRAIALLLAAALCCGTVNAQVPHKINYQGYLTNPGGTPVNATAVMTFRLYDAASGGSALYTETQLSVNVANGIFDVVLGAVTPIALPFDVPYWLTVTINADGEMSPRQLVTASPYALRSANADALAPAATVAGAQITGAISSATLPAGNITGTIPDSRLATNISRLDASQTRSASLAFADQTLALRNSAVTFSTTLRASSATSSRTIAFPDTSGTVITSGNLSDITAVGNVTAGTWNGLAIGAAKGGTGIDTSATPAQSLLRTTGTGAWGTLPAGADGQVLKISGGLVAWATDNIGSGGVTNVDTGAGLTGGPITSTGSIGLATTYQLPQGCATNQVTKWNGSAWACAADDNAAPAGGTAGQVLAGTTGAPAWTDSPSLSGNLTLVNPSTASTGNILKGANRFIHNFGGANTFIGEESGNFTMTGNNNTGSGALALASNTTGYNNTASGQAALFINTTGFYNTASGARALLSNTTGDGNTASGAFALANNTTGRSNTASGAGALSFNTVGFYNTASGYGALQSNTTGDGNTASGQAALFSNTTGQNNIALGSNAGYNHTTDNFNIDIGNNGVAGENGTIRIGTDGPHTRTFISGIRGVTTGSASAIPVLIDIDGQLGTASSSRRFKDGIADMDAASGALMKLRPVTFHYKTDQNPSGRTLQYGLIAEEVAAVYPGLVAHSADGQVETVMYQFLPSMLLNEYQKQQHTIAAQAVAMSKQAMALTRQTVALTRQTTRIAELERDHLAQMARNAELEQDRQAQTTRLDALEQQASEMALLKQQVAQLAQLQQQAAGLAPAAGRRGPLATAELAAAR